MIKNILSSKLYNFPIKLTIALTFLCNSRCKTCNIWKIYKNDPEKIKKELEIGEWKKIISTFKRVGWIEFTGGELTLKKDLDKIISYAYNNTDMITGGLTTNATNPNTLNLIEKILRQIPRNKDLIIGISLDGMPIQHNKIRGIENNFENAITLYDNLSVLKNKYENLIPHIAYTISEYNAGNFKLFYNYLKDNNDISIKEITLSIQHFNNFYFIDFKEKKQIKEELRKYIISDIKDYIEINKYQINNNIFERIKSIFYHYYLKKIPIYLDNIYQQIIPCVAGKYSAYIDPYGNIYPCSQWSKELGNLSSFKYPQYSSSLNDIWNSDTSKEIRNLIRTNKCPNCWTPCEAQASWLMNFGLLRGWW